MTIRGFHGDCPTAEWAGHPAYDTLRANPDGTVLCSACGATDLLPKVEAVVNRLDKKWRGSFAVA